MEECHRVEAGEKKGKTRTQIEDENDLLLVCACAFGCFHVNHNIQYLSTYKLEIMKNSRSSNSFRGIINALSI